MPHLCRLMVFALTFLPVVSSATNMALTSNNPNVARIGYLSPGATPAPAGINDGSLILPTPLCIMTNNWLHTVGYDLGTWVQSPQITIRQTSGGTRNRMLDVDVYTSSGGVTHFTGLPDVDDITLSLDGATSYVMIRPVAKQPTGADDNLLLREIEVDTTKPTSTRANWAFGIAPTWSGYAYVASGAGFTDGDRYADTAFAGLGSVTVFDLGTRRTIGGFGVGQDVTSGRKVWQSVLIEFSDDNFATVSGSRSLTLYNQLVFQQLDFPWIKARYVRVTDSGRLAPNGTETDNNTGVTEIQILDAAPEPKGTVVAIH